MHHLHQLLRGQRQRALGKMELVYLGTENENDAVAVN
jgi:hypothetical protein